MVEIGRPNSEQRACDGSLHIGGDPCHRRVVIHHPERGVPWPEHVEPTPYQTSGD